MWIEIHAYASSVATRQDPDREQSSKTKGILALFKAVYAKTRPARNLFPEQGKTGGRCRSSGVNSWRLSGFLQADEYLVSKRFAGAELQTSV